MAQFLIKKNKDMTDINHKANEVYSEETCMYRLKTYVLLNNSQMYNYVKLMEQKFSK